jgi:hypothetical protein
VNLRTAVPVDDEVSRLLHIPIRGIDPDLHLSILQAVTGAAPVIGEEVVMITIIPPLIIEVIMDEVITIITHDPIPAGIMMTIVEDVAEVVEEATVAVVLHVDMMTEEVTEEAGVVAMRAEEEVAAEVVVQMVVTLMIVMGRKTSSPTTWTTSHQKMIPWQHGPFSLAILS